MMTQNNENLDVSYHPDDQYGDELAELEEQNSQENYGSEEAENVEEL